MNNNLYRFGVVTACLLLAGQVGVCASTSADPWEKTVPVDNREWFGFDGIEGEKLFTNEDLQTTLRQPDGDFKIEFQLYKARTVQKETDSVQIEVARRPYLLRWAPKKDLWKIIKGNNAGQALIQLNNKDEFKSKSRPLGRLLGLEKQYTVKRPAPPFSDFENALVV